MEEMDEAKFEDWINSHMSKVDEKKSEFKFKIAGDVTENKMRQRGADDCVDGVCTLDDGLNTSPNSSEFDGLESIYCDMDNTPIMDAYMPVEKRVEYYNTLSEEMKNIAVENCLMKYTSTPTYFFGEFLYNVCKGSPNYPLVCKVVNELMHSHGEMAVELFIEIFEDDRNFNKYNTSEMLVAFYSMRDKYDIERYYFLQFIKLTTRPLEYIHSTLMKVECYIQDHEMCILINTILKTYCLDKFWENATDKSRRAYIMMTAYWTEFDSDGSGRNVEDEFVTFEADPEVDPEADPEVDPEVVSEADPEVKPEVKPEADSEVVSEADSEVVSEADSEVVSEADSEVVSEADSKDEDELVVFDADSDEFALEEYVPETFNFDGREFYNRVLSFCDDETVDYNIRADAADCLIRVKEYNERAKDVLKRLGGSRNIYENKQNIHMINFDGIIEAVSETPYLGEIPFGIITEDISRDIPDEHLDAFDDAINRINNDRVRYTDGKWTAAEGLCRVFNYIVTTKSLQDQRREMVKRLGEEIVESNGTCSSGHFRRILNALAGFNGLSPTIAWEHQIVSMFRQSLNKYIQDYPDDDVMVEALMEMASLENGESTPRPNYNEILISSISNIEKDLKQEFVESGLVDDEKFIECFRVAMQHYHYSSN